MSSVDASGEILTSNRSHSVIYEISQQNAYAKNEKPCQMRIANFDFCMALSIKSKKRNTINVKLERSENTSSINLYVVVLWPQTKCCSRDTRPRSRFVDISGNSTKLSSHTTHTHEPSGFHGFHLHSTLSHNLKFIMLH